MKRHGTSAVVVFSVAVLLCASATAAPFYSFEASTDYEGGNIQYAADSGLSPVSGSVTGAPIGSGFATAAANFLSVSASTSADDLITAEATSSFSDSFFFEDNGSPILSGTAIVTFVYMLQAVSGPALGNVPDAAVSGQINTLSESDFDEVFVEDGTANGSFSLELTGDLSSGLFISLEGNTGGPNGSASMNFFVQEIEVNGEIVYQVPEPSTWILLGTGLLGLMISRRRKSAAGTRENL